MKVYKKQQKEKNGQKLPKLGFMIISAVLSALMIIGVGVFCTSASKAADNAPYFAPDFDDEDETDEEETTDAETTGAPETSAYAGTSELHGTDTETDTDTGTDETASTETERESGTQEPVTTEPVTEPPVTKPPVTEPVTEKTDPKGPEDSQNYREYNGRTFGPNETFVGEYKTDRVSIGVSNVREGDLSYYICDIKLKSAKDFHTAFAGGSIAGRAYTSQIAASVGAGFAVNGDFCGFHSSGIIIRDGGLYRDRKSDNWDLCYMNKYGDLITCKNDKESGKALVNGGARQSWCFGPTLVSNYKALKNSEFNTPNLSRKDWARESRTAIGQVDKLHYIILVVDAVRNKNAGGGWTTVGGMNFDELAATFEALGCKVAYNLDGGGSTTMYLNGKVANNPCMEGERKVSDIIYFK